MIFLIINADDLGWCEERDRGCLRAFREGIVTSASLLANGPSFVSAASLAAKAGLPIGVHLNLSDGPTLTGRIEGLTDANGLLPGKVRLRKCLITGNCDLVGVRNELAAQIERIFSAGLRPGHLDGHQHCHIFPHLTAITTGLANKYGITAMRTSLPAEPAKHEEDDELAEALALYRRFGPQAHETIVAAGLETTDGLWGLPLLNRLDTSSLCQLLDKLPPGRWELMTHPGYIREEGTPFDGSQRQVELQALLSEDAKEIITKRQIRLCTFGDLSCAS